MKELIERLETATGPDRELDAAIARWIGFEVQYSTEINPQPCIWDGGYVEPYTASLDAALKLAPEGYGFKADCGLGFGHSFTVGHVGANKLYDRPEGWGKAATPALALCIAALYARTSDI